MCAMEKDERRELFHKDLFGGEKKEASGEFYLSKVLQQFSDFDKTLQFTFSFYLPSLQKITPALSLALFFHNLGKNRSIYQYFHYLQCPFLQIGFLCSFFTLGEIQKPAGHVPVKLALGVPA